MSTLIGLAGRARVGKDTAAEYLQDRFGVCQLSFAAPIKEVVRDLFDLGPEHLDGDLKEVPIPLIGRSPRELLQTLGTEWGRECVNPEIWLIVAGLRLARVRAECGREGVWFPGAVFSDVRFENEALWIRNQGGLIIHIDRTDAAAVHAHASESGVAIQPRDVYVPNNSSFEEFFLRLEDVVMAFTAESGRVA